ncbi:MAG: type II toxin-antitoxin system PemK/MazF family toxin [Thermoplasmataceae archaeon]
MKLSAGDVVVAKIQFTDTFEVKTRPALVLFKDYGNVVIAGITSNMGMDGVPFLKSEGAVKDSVIKLNYIFTVSEQMISKVLLRLTSEKRELIYSELIHRLNSLNL